VFGTYWPDVQNLDRHGTCPAGTVLSSTHGQAGPDLFPDVPSATSFLSGMSPVGAPGVSGYGITAVAGFEYVLSALLESTAVTT
jgi:hypothetical protein